ncbi:MAG TPA: amidohydrolase [Cellulomonas sp.]
MSGPRATLLRHARPAGGRGTQDLLLVAGRVARVAPGGTLGTDAGPAGATTVLDLAGRTVLPGLRDAHVHLTQWVVRRERLDLSGATSAAETLALVRAALPTWPADLLVGHGFRDALWPDAPTLAALDAAVGARPVVLVSQDLHCGWLSSAAADRLGVRPGTDGMLREGPWIHGLDLLDRDARPPVGAYREAGLAAARRGVVEVVDLENADNATDWPARVAAGADALRVQASVWPDRLDDAIARGLRTGDVLDLTGLVTMGPLKVVADGSLNTRTAWCWDPYPGLAADHPHPCGLPAVTPDELDDLLDRAHRHGLHVTVHAIGDRTLSAVLDAFERHGSVDRHGSFDGRSPGTRASAPGTIEHAQLLRPADLPRLARLGLVASVQPEHALDDRAVADRYWAGRTDRAFAYRALHEAGVPLRLGSDAPVAPLDPWQAIAAAVTRTRDDLPPWHPEQRLPREVAIAASTAVGRLDLRPGDVADLVVLDADPLTAPPETLRTLPVAATAVAGRWTWTCLEGTA